jgi:hypothetical protein
MIERRELKNLKELLGKFPAVVLIGPRQIGKTTLAQSCGSMTNGLYLDLESQRDLRKLSDPEDYLGKRQDRLVILDEIQRLPGLFPSLRGLIDEGRTKGFTSGRFLLLGSASLELIQQSSETLAGRIAYIELHPLDATEVSDAPLDSLWLRGGFPESFLAASDSDSAQYRDFLIRSYLERDVPLYGGRLTPIRLRKLWTMLAHSQGGIANIAVLSRSLEIDGRTAAGYIELLEKMLLLRRLLPWHVNTKKRIIKSPKLYVRDSGLLHELLGIADIEALLAHPVVGASWEGFVIENLLACTPARTESYFYRTNTGSEVDLILRFRSGEVWAVEIKRGLSPRLTAGFHTAISDVKPDRTFVVYGGDERFQLQPDIEMISLRLLQEELLGR